MYFLPPSLRERKNIPVKLWGALSITGSLLFNHSLPLTPLSCLLVQIGSSAVVQAPVPWVHHRAFSTPPGCGGWIRLSRVNSALETSCERCPCDPGLHNGPVEAPWSPFLFGIPSPPSLSCMLSGCNMWQKRHWTHPQTYLDSNPSPASCLFILVLPLLSMWLWENSSTSLSSSFLLCKPLVNKNSLFTWLYKL